MNQSIYSLLARQHVILLANCFKNLILNKQNLHYEFSLNNNHYQVSLNLINYSLENFGISMLIKDITLLKENELRIRSLMQELTESNQELQSFTYTASHDLRNLY